jgi:hypothetical protein
MTSLPPRPPVIILNSSPVIHLTVALSGLDVLPALYGRVLVPEPVLRELDAGAQLDDTARRLRAVSGIEVSAMAAGVAPLLTGELDLGEAAVIQLALDLPGATVVLDDLKAMRVASIASPMLRRCNWCESTLTPSWGLGKEASRAFGFALERGSGVA